MSLLHHRLKWRIALGLLVSADDSDAFSAVYQLLAERVASRYPQFSVSDLPVGFDEDVTFRCQCQATFSPH